uniref:Cytosolic Fe-S cluster assembly factor NUBP2 homolog n=1 Tax=Tabanus bromius TaxID=304241 RepID=A0A0K8TTN4_TABBR
MLDKVKHVIIVLSGKGGVGKSTVSTQLALALKETGFKVGILDIDLCGPSVPYLLGIENKDVFQSEGGWVPVYADSSQQLAVMSIAFLLKNRNDAIIWRGPKKTAMIKQFISDVQWDEMDYLIIDTPPGTSDEHITVMECMRDVKCDGAIIVTTPQEVALDDVRKEITFCRKTNLNVIGIVENMSGFICPNCNECTNIFSSKGGECLAELTKIPLLTTIPIDPRIGLLADTCKSVLTEVPDSGVSKAYIELVGKLTGKTS